MAQEIYEVNPQPFQIDPVEHAVVEAGWGEALIGDKSDLLRHLGARPLADFVQDHPILHPYPVRPVLSAGVS